MSGTRWARRGVALALTAALTAALGACGSDDNDSTGTASGSTQASAGTSTGAAASCGGDAVKIKVITNLSSPASRPFPEFGTGAKAAADALTKDCTLGAPVEVSVCDDKFSPNGAAVCAREAVSDKVVGVVQYTGFGDSIVPILQAAKIPVLNSGTSSSESTSTYSFPFVPSIPALMGEVSIAGATGAKSLVVTPVDLPSVKFLTGVVAAQAAGLGIKALSPIAIPPTETDMASYAGQVLSSGADAVLPVIGDTQSLALAKSLIQQGASFQDGLWISSLASGASPPILSELGSDAEGTLAASFTWSPTDPDGPGMQQFLDEVKASGQPSGANDLTVYAVAGWAGVHVIADTLKGGDMTAAALEEGLNTGRNDPQFENYGLPPTDFTKPAFSSGPLAKLRVFTKYSSAWKVNAEGTPEPLAPDWFDVTQPLKVQ